MFKATIGSYIRDLRLKNGMTQLALAEKLHVTDKAVSKWERDLSYPDIRILPQLADVLGVSVSDIIRESDDGGSSERLLKQYESFSDLRAPLHIILGCADLLETYREDELKFYRYLDAVRVSGQYLLSALNRMHGESGHTQELEKMLEEQSTKCGTDELTYDFHGKRILVAEDIKVNQEILKELLKPTGAELEFAENGKLCVEMVMKHQTGYYDLILMDLVMPEMTGIEATQKIRSLSDRVKAAIPIIALTANVEDRDRIAAFEAGMNAFTEKPVHLDRLLSNMKEFL